MCTKDTQHFEQLKKHLTRKRDAVNIMKETPDMIEFTVSNKFFEKWFHVRYLDSFSEDEPSTRHLQKERPRGHHYWMSFDQENYPQKGRFVTITDMSWYADEEDLVQAVKRFCRNWRA